MDHCKCLWQKNAASHVELRVVFWHSTASFPLIWSRGLPLWLGTLLAGGKSIWLNCLFWHNSLVQSWLRITEAQVQEEGIRVLRVWEDEQSSWKTERLISGRNNMSSHHSNFPHRCKKATVYSLSAVKEANQTHWWALTGLHKCINSILMSQRCHWRGTSVDLFQMC